MYHGLVPNTIPASLCAERVELDEVEAMPGFATLLMPFAAVKCELSDSWCSRAVALCSEGSRVDFTASLLPVFSDFCGHNPLPDKVLFMSSVI